MSSSPLNFEWSAVPTEAVTLAMIKDAIRERHRGAAADLTLYRDHVSYSVAVRSAAP